MFSDNGIYNPLATADVVQHLMRWRGCYEYSLFQIWSKHVYAFYSFIYFGFQKHSEKSFYSKQTILYLYHLHPI